MSTSVSVTGMSVTTKVSSNLQIAETNAEANYGDSINQQRAGVLEPASTITGADGSFYYTADGRNDGYSSSQTFTAYSEASVASPSNAFNNVPANKQYFDAGFNDTYQFSHTGEDVNNYAYAYIDYSFYLKGAASSAGQKITLATCNMLYAGQEIDSSFAWRVGMFVSETEKDETVADSTSAAAGNLVTILDFGNDSTNQNEVTKPIKPANGTNVTSYYNDSACTEAATGTADGNTTYYIKGETTGPKAVSSTSALAAVEEAGEDAIVHTFDNSDINTVKYYKVLVRLWLEGEDVSCTSTTYAELTSAWTLSLEFKLGDGTAETAPVNQIGSEE